MKYFKIGYWNNNILASILIFLFIPFHYSCNTSEKQVVKFDEKKELEDIFQLEKFKKLNIDEEYKDLTTEYYDKTFLITEDLIDIGGSMANIPSLTDTKNVNLFNVEERKEDFIKESLKTIWDLTILSKDVLKMTKTFYERNELTATFSEEKKSLSKEIDEFINESSKDSILILVFGNVFETEKIDNSYKAMGNYCKDDEEIFDYVEPIIENNDKLLKKSIEIKRKIKLNKYLGLEVDIKRIADLSGSILSNKGKTIDFSTNSDLLNEYFELYRDIVFKINNQPKFEIPYEDWSTEKQEKLKNFTDKTNEMLKIINQQFLH